MTRNWTIWGNWGATCGVGVQFGLCAIAALRHQAGIGITHDFALPMAGDLRRLAPHQFHLTRSFYMLRHTDDRRLPRMNRFSGLLATYLAQGGAGA